MTTMTVSEATMPTFMHMEGGETAAMDETSLEASTATATRRRDGYKKIPTMRIAALIMLGIISSSSSSSGAALAFVPPLPSSQQPSKCRGPGHDLSSSRLPPLPQKALFARNYARSSSRKDTALMMFNKKQIPLGAGYVFVKQSVHTFRLSSPF